MDHEDTQGLLADLFFGKNIENTHDVFDAYSPLKIVEFTESLFFRSNEFLVHRNDRICSAEEAELIFEFIFNRKAGRERQGRTVQSILDDLLASKEFSITYDMLLWEFSQKNELEISLAHENSRFVFLKSEIPIKIKFNEHPSSRHNLQTTAVKFSKIPLLELEKLPLAVYHQRLQVIIFLLGQLNKKFPQAFGSQKTVVFSFGDQSPLEKSVCFCSNNIDDYLVPDSDFILTHGYKEFHSTFLNSLKWVEREDKAYWRGTDTSTANYQNFSRSPRIKLCALSQEYPDYLDAGIVSIEKTPNYAIKNHYYTEFKLSKKRDPQEMILNYKYQIDVDGNSNAWRSFYLKLLSGSPVLKIKSEFGYQQWYYHRLIPWVHYVPVAHDCSDLVKKIEFLRENPILAEAIGIEGQKVALSMTYEKEVDLAVGMLIKAFYNL